MERRDNEFPPYPAIAELPAGLTDDERHAFATKLIAEQGDGLGDYLFAAIRVVTDYDEQGRWLDMALLVQEIVGEPITLSYRACDRITAEDDDEPVPGEYTSRTIH